MWNIMSYHDQLFFTKKSSSLAKAGQAWSTSALSASLCCSEHKWGSNFMSEEQSRGMSAILNEDWENHLGSKKPRNMRFLEKDPYVYVYTFILTLYINIIHVYIYIYMFLLLDGDNDKLPIVGMAAAGRMWWSPKAVPIRKGPGGMGANHW